MKTCILCHQLLEAGERVQAFAMKTFIFKPAGEKDTINPAEASPDELAESRKEFKKTSMATMFLTYDPEAWPDDAFNPRHVACSVKYTGMVSGTPEVRMKHAIRYHRSTVKR